MDINQIKKRLSQLQNTTSTKENMWKPQPGKTQIRMVPYEFNKSNPFIELYFHYNLGDNKTHLSPVSFGRPDPINEFADKLKSTGNREEWLQGKKLEPKMRTFVPVVVRGQERDGVKFWGFGKTVYQELLSIIADPDYGDITDPVNGRDIAVEFKTAEETGKSFPSTTIRVKPNQTPITEDAAILEAIKETQKNINEIYQERSYDELAQTLGDYLNDDSTETTNEKPTKEVADVKATTTSYSSQETSDTFDDLFNR